MAKAEVPATRFIDLGESIIPAEDIEGASKYDCLRLFRSTDHYIVIDYSDFASITVYYPDKNQRDIYFRALAAVLTGAVQPRIELSK